VTEGPTPALRPSPALDTFAAPENDHRPRSWPVPFSIAGHRDSLPPCGVPRHVARVPRARFYNRRFTSRAPEKTSLSETARRAPWETRRRSTSRPRLGPSACASCLPAAPDHLAVIRPPTAARLTALLPASGPSTPTFRHGLPDVPRSSRGRGGAQALSAEGASVESNPLTPLFTARGEDRLRKSLLPDS